MRQQRIGQSIRELEQDLLKAEGPSLDSFMGLGPKKDLRWMRSNTHTHGQQKNGQSRQSVSLQTDINCNLRVFYICLLEWCYSSDTATPEQQSTLQRFKRLVYRTDPHHHDFESIPLEFRKLYRNHGFRKILAEFFVRLGHDQRKLGELISQYPLIDAVMVTALRSCLFEPIGQWKLLDNDKLVGLFGGVGLPCYKLAQHEVVFTANKWRMVMECGNYLKLIPLESISAEYRDSGESPRQPTSPLSPLSPILHRCIKRMDSIVSIELDESDLIDEKIDLLASQCQVLHEQLGQLDDAEGTPMAVRQVESVYYGEESFRKNNSSVVEKHSNVEDYFRIKLFNVQDSPQSITERVECVGSSANTEQCNCCQDEAESESKQHDSQSLDSHKEMAATNLKPSMDSTHNFEVLPLESTPLRLMFSPPKIEMLTINDLNLHDKVQSPVYNTTKAIHTSNTMTRIVSLKDKYITIKDTPVSSAAASGTDISQPTTNTSQRSTTSACKHFNLNTPETQRLTIQTPDKCSPASSHLSSSLKNLLFKYVGSPPKIVVINVEPSEQFQLPKSQRQLIRPPPLDKPLTFRQARHRPRA